ncbi:MAG: protein kinase [Pseudomonadota bacterium]
MDIPGFEIEHEIGRGGMARVWLATQTKFGRWVALKVVSSDFAKDPQFRKRFLQESRINAQLTHPNIVQVYDVGAHDSLLYLVMEYLPGGDLNARLDRGLHVSELIDVAKDIGRALDFAQRKGVVHRDIKPENILFRDDGSAVLTDFGIARLATPDISLTRDGTVVGTPQYMSPEQAAGRALDGRSDLYSLGVVLFRMLTGDVPFNAESAVAIGIKHLQEPVPKLPSYLAAFQDVIDKALAKEPDVRFQSGAEFADALEQVQHDGALPNQTIKTRAVSTQEIRAVGSQLLTAVRDVPRAKPARGPRKSAALRYLPLLTVSLLVLGGSWVLTQQPQLVSQLLARAGVTNELALDDAWNDAQALRRDPNQSLTTIAAAYRRVLELNPDHTGASTALAGLASQWKAEVREALNDGNLSRARTQIDEGLAALPGDSELMRLKTELGNRERANSLLASTQELLQSRGLEDVTTATAAIQAYQEVLRLVPSQQQARLELNTLAGYYAGLAMESAEAKELDNAIAYLDRAMAANPDNPELLAVRERIREASLVVDRIRELLSQASEYRAAGQLVNPPGENAAELYRRVLATDPSNGVAAQAMDELNAQLISRTGALLEARSFDEAADLVDRAGAIGLDPEMVADLRSELRRTTERLNRVSTLLEEAERFMQLGYLTQPEKSNAVSNLRAVQQLEPGNARAEALLEVVARRLAQVAEQAHQAGLIQEARNYLDLALAVTPNVSDWRVKRDAWQVEAQSEANGT